MQLKARDLEHLPLHELHRQHGAKFGPFAGYEMPLFYAAGLIREHRHTREAAGLFDISHMAPVMLSGARAADMIGFLCPYDAAAQSTGRARYTFFLNDQAGIIDDLIVSRLAEDRFLIVCNAGCADKDLEHLLRYGSKYGVEIERLERVFLALQGPQAEAVMAALGHDVAGMRFFDVAEPAPGWFISRTGYTGEDGFEILVPVDSAGEFAAALLADQHVLLAGLGARDSLRLEAALPLYGQDIAADITPMEAGLGWAIPKSHREGGDFLGAVALAQKCLTGPARRRIGLRPQGSAPVRTHAQILAADGQSVGEVTSGGFGPSVNHPIALGLIEFDAEGPLHAQLRGRETSLEIVPLPFHPHSYKR